MNMGGLMEHPDTDFVQTSRWFRGDATHTPPPSTLAIFVACSYLLTWAD